MSSTWARMFSPAVLLSEKHIVNQRNIAKGENDRRQNWRWKGNASIQKTTLEALG